MSKLEIEIEGPSSALTARDTVPGGVYLWESHHGERPVMRAATMKDGMYVFHCLDNGGVALCAGDTMLFRATRKATLNIKR